MAYENHFHLFLSLFFFPGNMLPFFPEKVNNVTVTIGQSAELRCKVDNLNNYKVVQYK